MTQILFLAASPKDLSPLGLEKEAKAIEAKLSDREQDAALELVPKWAVRPDDLLQVVNEGAPSVLHYSGHGSSTNELCLLDADGNTAKVSKEALERFFKLLHGKTRVVVLNACYSEGQSEVIKEHVDCVIGMSTKVKDSSAIAFASAFYRAISYGKSVQEAFDQGTASIDLEGLRGADTPQLLHREGVDPSTVYLLETPGKTMVDSEWMRYAPAPRELLQHQKYHAFLSYRSVDRHWVLNLYDVLRQHGFRVFLDQCSIEAGSALIDQLEDGLDQSAAGILVWSPATQSSTWCRREYRVMEARAEKPGFHFVPLRLKGGELPSFATSRVFLDFSEYPDGPNGGELLRLLHAISGRSLSEAAVRFASDQDQAAKLATQDIAAAVMNGRSKDIVRLFEAGGLPWNSSPTLGCQATKGLIRLGAYDEALEMLEAIEAQFPNAIRPKQLHALTLGRREAEGDLDKAQRILGRLIAAGERDPETLGIYGSSWMDRYRESGDIEDLRQSRDSYAEAFEDASDDYYTGINAASKSVMLGELDVAKQTAQSVRACLEQDEEDASYWKLATRGEADLILGDVEASVENYRAAVRLARRERGSLEATWVQLESLRQPLGVPDDAWAALEDIFSSVRGDKA